MLISIHSFIVFIISHNGLEVFVLLFILVFSITGMLCLYSILAVTAKIINKSTKKALILVTMVLRFLTFIFPQIKTFLFMDVRPQVISPYLAGKVYRNLFFIYPCTEIKSKKQRSIDHKTVQSNHSSYTGNK